LASGIEPFPPEGAIGLGNRTLWHARNLVRMEGFEPTASCTPSMRSARLSYTLMNFGPASPSRTGFSPSSGERHAPHRLKRAELGWGGRNRTPGAVRRLINSQVALPTSPTPQQSVRAGLPGQSPRPPIGVVNGVTTHHKPGTPGGSRTLGVRFRGPAPYPSGPRGPKMEAPEGFEPSTFGFVDRCSSPG
jgi:hypothetical protein